MAMAIVMKRIYEPPSSTDGVRVLVDRLWPRGVSKERAAVDSWLRELAPSDALRKWYHNRGTWPDFRKRYLKELTLPGAAEALSELYHLADRHDRVTLLFGSKNEEQNNATVLKELLGGMRKPPTGTGHAVKAARVRQAKRIPRK
jgi:uncharacterized protein YeaO (DUF488 family)